MTLTTTMLDYYKKEYAVFNPEKALKFLDVLIKQLRIFETKSDFIVHDHIKQEYFSIDPTKVQDLYDHCYRWYYYRRLEEKNVWVRNLKSLLEEKTSKEVCPVLYISILTILKFFAVSYYSTIKFSFDEFSIRLSEHVTRSINYNNCEDIVNILISEGLLIVSRKNVFSKQIEISDDTVRLDLMCMSTSPVCVVPQDNPIKFSCFYALDTLAYVVYKYQSTESLNPVSMMLNIYKNNNDQKSFDMLKEFYMKNNNLSYYEIQKDANKTSENYDHLVMIYKNRMLLNEYFFQILALSPFQDYYVDPEKIRFNLLYYRRYDLIYRLYP